MCVLPYRYRKMSLLLQKGALIMYFMQECNSGDWTALQTQPRVIRPYVKKVGKAVVGKVVVAQAVRVQ